MYVKNYTPIPEVGMNIGAGGYVRSTHKKAFN